MSRVRDIVTRATALVEAVTALLATQTVTHLVNAAKAVGAEDYVKRAADELVARLHSVNLWLDENLRLPLRDLGVLQGLLRLISPLVRGVGDLFDAIGDGTAARMGLDGVLVATDALSKGVQTGRKMVDAGATFLEGMPTEADLNRLMGAFADMMSTLRAWTTDVLEGVDAVAA